MTGWEEILERETLTKEERKKVCGWLMTTESHMNNLIASYFTVKDFKAVWERKIGDGVIGGKACGMLAARKLVQLKLPECAAHLEPHNSYFIGTNVFYQYLVVNRCLAFNSAHRFTTRYW